MPRVSSIFGGALLVAGGPSMSKSQSDGLASNLLAALRLCLSSCSRLQAPEPCPEVLDLLAEMRMTPRQVQHYYRTFRRVKQFDPLTLAVGPQEASTASMTRLVQNDRQYVSKILLLLLDVAGFREKITWDGFLFVFIQFCRLSKVELCQAMFYIISKSMRSWTVRYLTSTQLQEFYRDYEHCPVRSFDTAAIDFSRLPLAKYKMPDFIQLMFRFSELINPCMHLQRSLQQALPSLAFWSDYDGIKTLNRRITLDFFRYKKVMTLLEVVADAERGPGQVKKKQHVEQIVSEKDPLVAAKDAISKDCASGNIPLPFGEPPPPRPARTIEQMKLPWLEAHLQLNEDPVTGRALGTAALQEIMKAEKPWKPGPNEPRSVEGAKQIISASFGTRMRGQTAAGQVLPAKQPESKYMDGIMRNQELHFIRTSRENARDEDTLVALMERSFPCELLDRPSHR